MDHLQIQVRQLVSLHNEMEIKISNEGVLEGIASLRRPFQDLNTCAL